MACSHLRLDSDNRQWLHSSWELCTVMRADSLKGQCHDIFASRLFHESSTPKPLKITLGSFRIFGKFAEIFASQGAPPVSTTPVAILPPVRWCISSCEYLCEFWKKFETAFLTLHPVAAEVRGIGHQEMVKPTAYSELCPRYYNYAYLFLVNGYSVRLLYCWIVLCSLFMWTGVVNLESRSTFMLRKLEVRPC
jgi:hypothetical protein